MLYSHVLRIEWMRICSYLKYSLLIYYVIFWITRLRAINKKGWFRWLWWDSVIDARGRRRRFTIIVCLSKNSNFIWTFLSISHSPWLTKQYYRKCSIWWLSSRCYWISRLQTWEFMGTMDSWWMEHRLSCKLF